MRDLILLRGAAGCGKSFWIEENKLEKYTINVDKIRLLFQSPQVNINGEQSISQNNDNKVWELVLKILEERMINGDFTIIDATHSRASLIQKYKDLCDKYRYRCTVVNFNNDLKRILEQNDSRDQYKKVPEDIIEMMVERIKTQKVPGWVSEIKYTEFFDYFPVIKSFDFNKYKKIIHIGDIHGCLDPLKEFFDSYPYTEDNFYIFLGDYLDRGIQNKEVLEFLFTLQNKKNVLFLEGNHEQWLRYYSQEDVDKISSSEFVKYTIPQIESLDKKDIREFCRRLGQLAYYQFKDNVYFVNHAGYPIIPNKFTASKLLIKGIGKYEDYLKIEDTWNNFTPSNYFQIHGHRNTEKSPICNGRVFNLCDTVEFGGSLRILILDKDGCEEVLIKNKTFLQQKEEIPTSKKEIDPDEVIKELSQCKYVQVKKLSGNVVSFNFTREAFYSKKWNHLTTKARGLFVNLSTKEIVARSYDKFFNIDENSENKMNELRRKLIFPVTAFIKYNGYLGIVGYDSENDTLFVSTKSSDSGQMREIFYEILSKYDLEKLKIFCKEKNQSLIFEVIDPINDPHIIEYKDREIILLDVIDRTWEFHRSFNLEEIANLFGFKYKETYCILNNYNELFEFKEEITKKDYKYNNQYVEGFVIEDSNHYMVKLKTYYYNLWKFMRWIKEQVSLGRSIETQKLVTAEQNRIYYFIKNQEDLKIKSIIDIRSMYEDLNVQE